MNPHLSPRLLRVVLLLAALLLASCGAGARGSGRVVSESRPVSNISSVTLRGVGTLIVTQRDQEALTITADDNILPLLSSTVTGGRLALGPSSGAGIANVQQLTYRLTVRQLRSVEVSGAADVELLDMRTDRLAVAIDGTSDVSVTGQAAALDLTISGAGSFKGAGLTSAAATVRVRGSGGAVVRVSDTLDARVSGAGDVRYIGDPQVTQQITGAGTVAQQGQ